MDELLKGLARELAVARHHFQYSCPDDYAKAILALVERARKEAFEAAAAICDAKADREYPESCRAAATAIRALGHTGGAGK